MLISAEKCVGFRGRRSLKYWWRWDIACTVGLRISPSFAGFSMTKYKHSLLSCVQTCTTRYFPSFAGQILMDVPTAFCIVQRTMQYPIIQNSEITTFASANYFSLHFSKDDAILRPFILSNFVAVTFGECRWQCGHTRQPWPMSPNLNDEHDNPDALVYLLIYRGKKTFELRAPVYNPIADCSVFLMHT